VLDELATFGIVPKDETPPERAREMLNDIYRHELRRLRERLGRKEIEKAAYSDHVIALRKKYFLLSIPVKHWVYS
jgi:hypothetical protein